MNPLEYAARGWHLFPVHGVRHDRTCTCSEGALCKNKGKHPRTVNGVKDATDDTATITRWVDTYGADCNWGLACGTVSDMVVVDIDPRHGGDVELDRWQQENGALPVTLTSLTGGSGFHYFFRYPRDGEGVKNRNSMLPGIDVRSDGGYVVIPPSRHESGRTYAWRDADSPVSPLPEQLLRLIRLQSSPGARRDLKNIVKIGDGERNDTLFRLACRLRRQLSDDMIAVRGSVYAYNAFTCEPPLEESEVEKILDSAFKQDHSAGVEINFVADEGIRNLTDDGNAYRIIDYNTSDLRYVPTWGWMRWSGRTWRPDQDSVAITERARAVHGVIRSEAQRVEDPETRQQIVKWAHKSESAGAIAAMITLARSDGRVARSHEAFDADPGVLSCRNGVLDLRTGELRDHSPDDLITRSTNVFYDPDAVSPEWEHFILNACDEDPELVSYVQRAAGYTLTGFTSEEALFIVTGPQASGKSTFVDGLSAAMGGYGSTMSADTILMRGVQSRRDNELARLVGMRFAAIVEMPEGERLDEASVKQMTGGDEVTARFLYKNPFSYRPHFKMWIATNHEPRINDQAIWRRVKKIPFPRSTPRSQRDPRLKRMIADPEVGGRAVLAWAVRGAQEWMRAGGLHEPQRVVAEVQEYFMSQDRLGSFLDTFTVVDPDAKVLLTQLYPAYSSWCMTTGERPVGMTTLWQKLSDRPGIGTVRIDSRQYVRGLRLKHDVMGSTETEGGSLWGTR